MSNELQTTNQPAETDSTLSIIQSLPDSLLLNSDIAEKASVSISNVLSKIQTAGMNDELDAVCNAAIVKLKDRLEEMKGRRMPGTRKLNEMIKSFTEIEAQMDGFIKKLSEERNKYATLKIKQQQEAEAARQRKLKAEEEKINLKSEAEIQIRNSFLNQLSGSKATLQNAFDQITLESYNDVAQSIFNWSELYLIDQFNNIQVNLRSVYLTQPELELIITNARIGKFDTYASEFKMGMRELKADLSQKLSGKKIELNAIAEQKRQQEEAAKAAAEAKNEADRKAAEKRIADAKAEQERLEKERNDREQKEKEDAAENDRLAKLKAEQDAEAQKQIEQTNLHFDSTVEVVSENKEVQAVESYEIEVKNPAGWLLIAQFWFQNEGMKLSSSEIEKKTFKQMKAFCEKWYKSNNLQGLSSPYIVYSPVYKVRAEK